MNQKNYHYCKKKITNRIYNTVFGMKERIIQFTLINIFILFFSLCNAQGLQNLSLLPTGGKITIKPGSSISVNSICINRNKNAPFGQNYTYAKGNGKASFDVHYTNGTIESLSLVEALNAGIVTLTATTSTVVDIAVNLNKTNISKIDFEILKNTTIAQSKELQSIDDFDFISKNFPNVISDQDNYWNQAGKINLLKDLELMDSNNLDFNTYEKHKDILQKIKPLLADSEHISFIGYKTEDLEIIINNLTSIGYYKNTSSISKNIERAINSLERDLPKLKPIISKYGSLFSSDIVNLKNIKTDFELLGYYGNELSSDFAQNIQTAINSLERDLPKLKPIISKYGYSFFSDIVNLKNIKTNLELLGYYGNELSSDFTQNIQTVINSFEEDIPHFKEILDFSPNNNSNSLYKILQVKKRLEYNGYSINKEKLKTSLLTSWNKYVDEVLVPEYKKDLVYKNLVTPIKSIKRVNTIHSIEYNWTNSEIDNFFDLLNVFNPKSDNRFKSFGIQKDSENEIYKVFNRNKDEIYSGENELELIKIIANNNKNNDNTYIFLEGFESPDKQSAFLSTLKIELKTNKNLNEFSINKLSRDDDYLNLVKTFEKFEHKLTKPVSDISTETINGINYFKVDFELEYRNLQNNSVEKFEVMVKKERTLKEIIKYLTKSFNSFKENISMADYFNKLKKHLIRVDPDISKEDELIIKLKKEFSDFRIVILNKKNRDVKG